MERVKVGTIGLVTLMAVIATSIAVTPVAARLASPSNRYDRQAVVNEAWYAMTGVPYTCGGKFYKGYLVSAWNYLASDISALKVIGSDFGWWRGSAGWSPYYTYYINPNYGYYQQLGRGGQCLFFIVLVLYRSEADQNYWKHDSWIELESSWRVIDYARVGDIIFKPRSTGIPHAAIVVYRSGDYVLLIDSNGPVEPNPSATFGYGEIISCWSTTITKLKNAGYRVYTGVDYYWY